MIGALRPAALATAASLLALALGIAAPASAQTFPARSGESGLLDVPDAETIPRGLGLLGAELRFDRTRTGPSDFGPFPLYTVAGITRGVEAGLTMREWGQPGDRRPGRLVFGGAVKLKLLSSTSYLPAVAVDAVVDRLNGDAVYGGRAIASTAPGANVRFAAFAGFEGGAERGLTYGGAVALVPRAGAELVLEALGGPRGENYGAAVRWRVTPTASASLGFNYLPGEEGFRVSLGLGFAPRRKEPPAAAAPAAPAPAPAPEEALASLAFLDDRPRFRLKLRAPDPSGAEPRSLRHAPWTTPSATRAPAGAVPGAALRPAAPSLEDLAEAQLREQEALADARQRRVAGTVEQLDAREKAAQEQGGQHGERERELAGREQQLDAREKRLAYRGPASQPARQLESVEAQLASQERNLGAQERSYVPALDSAQGREREAAAREDGERQEANRLAASVSGSASRALQVEVRRQALGARNRQLAALEARLLARGERLDALERQLRTRGERLDAWQRRLDARADRLDLLERLASDAKAGPGAAAARGEPKAPQPKDKAVFVMVVKSPTAIVREQAAAPAQPAPQSALHAGVAVEKAVAAATIVLFPSPASEISELDRETIDGIAKLAAAERCELLIWARAKDPSLTGEAQRRANEIRTRVLASGPLDPKQVVTRITTRPGAQGVDVVVSALRETAKAAAAPVAAKGPPALLAGETGKRQIREAVQAAQASIEACVGEAVSRRRLQRAEGALKVTVSPRGMVTKVVAGDGELGGAAMDECLGAASRGWLFPPAEAEYVVDVPITVISGGAAR